MQTSTTNTAEAARAPQIPRSSPLFEYSVVHSDKSANLMCVPFQQSMIDIGTILRGAYNSQGDGSGVAVIPGSGTYAMEAVARHFGTGKRCLVIRNGYFSYRWSDIFDVTKIAAEVRVCRALPSKGQEGLARPRFAPCPIDVVIAEIKRFRPAGE